MSISKEYQVPFFLLFYHYSEVHSMQSRSATTRSSLSGEKVSLPSIMDGSVHSGRSRNKSLINNVLADIVKTRRADEKKRRSTIKRMSVMSQSRFEIIQKSLFKAVKAFKRSFAATRNALSKDEDNHNSAFLNYEAIIYSHPWQPVGPQLFLFHRNLRSVREVHCRPQSVAVSVIFRNVSSLINYII